LTRADFFDANGDCHCDTCCGDSDCEFCNAPDEPLPMPTVECCVCDQQVPADGALRLSTEGARSYGLYACYDCELPFIAAVGAAPIPDQVKEWALAVPVCEHCAQPLEDPRVQRLCNMCWSRFRD
jgi:hypothetical protein